MILIIKLFMGQSLRYGLGDNKKRNNNNKRKEEKRKR